MLIRDARTDDWARIWPFWRRIVAAGETYSWDRDTGEAAARELWAGPGRRVFVVEDDAGEVVASASLKANYGGPAAAVANAGFMVAPGHGGRGYGRALAEHVLGPVRRIMPRDAGSGTHICGVVVGCQRSALSPSSALQLHAPDPARRGGPVRATRIAA